MYVAVNWTQLIFSSELRLPKDEESVQDSEQCRRGAHFLFLGHKPLKSETHSQCDARPTVTFPAAGHHRPLTGIKLYCLVTEARVCEQLAQGCYLKTERPGVEPATL